MINSRHLRIFLTVLALVSTCRARADLEVCPETAFKNPKTAKALAYLQSIQGVYKLGQCDVELHVCQSSGPVSQTGTLVGDLLITDAKGRKSYLQFDFPTETDSRRTIEILNGRIMFHYEFDDRHPDPVFGNRESIRVEFLKSQDKQNLISLEEGWYSTNDRKFRRKGSVYNWTLCHGDVSIAPKMGGLL